MSNYWEEVIEYLEDLWKKFLEGERETEERRVAESTLNRLRFDAAWNDAQLVPLLTKSHLLDLHDELSKVDEGIKEVSQVL